MARLPLLLLGACALASARAKTYNVHSTTDLVAAFEQLLSGDSISIKSAGTYSIDKPLRLANLHSVKISGRSQMDAVIDGGGATRLIELSQVQDALLENLVLKNGKSDSSSTSGGSGGALLLDTCTSVSMESVHVSTSAAELSGGGLVVFDSTGVRVEACAFTGNRATNAGGAIAALEATRLVVVDSSFTGNSASVGGALAARGGEGEGSSVSGCAFAGNSAEQDGGAIALNDAGFIAIGASNTFTGNAVKAAAAADAPLFVQTGSLTFVGGDKGGGRVRALCAGEPTPEVPDTLGGGGAAAAAAGTAGGGVPPPDGGPQRVAFSRISAFGLADSDRDRRHAERPDLSDPFVRISGTGGAHASTSVARNVGNVTWVGETLLVDVEPHHPVVLVELIDEDGGRDALLGHALVPLGRAGSGNGTFSLHGPHKHDGASGHGGVRLSWVAEDVAAWRASAGSPDAARADPAARWQLGAAARRAYDGRAAAAPVAALAFGAGLALGATLAAAAAVALSRARARAASPLA